MQERMRTILWSVVLSGFMAPQAFAQLSGGSVMAMTGPVMPIPVASGQPAKSALNAMYTPPTEGNPYRTVSGPSWIWTLNGAPAGVYINQPNQLSPSATLMATITSPRTYTMTATATATWTDSGQNSRSVTGTTGPIVITVVGVQKLQYFQNGNGFVDVSGTLYVLSGQPVSFQAVPSPNGSSFPATQPVWSGTSNASGTGQMISVVFNTLSSTTGDYKTGL